MTIHADEATERFLTVQTAGLGPADVMIRAASTLTGAWTEPRMVCRPSEYHRPNVMIYSAKVHPELTCADLVVTYATYTFEFAEQLSDSRIDSSRFVRLTCCG